MTDVTSSTEPPANKIPTKTLLTTAVGVFGASFMGAIWYTKRKQSREMAQAMAEATAAESGAATAAATSPTSAVLQPPRIPPSTVPNSNAASWKPPKMSPAEYAAAKRDATFFAFKTLGYGTLLAFGSFGLMATAVGYWLDVRNFREFSDKLQIIVPRQTSRLRTFLGGKKLEMNEEEEKELAAIDWEEK